MNNSDSSLPFENTFHETKLAIQAATHAGMKIMQLYNKNITSRLKDDNEPVTLADIESDTIIRKTLSSTNYSILSEESSDDKKRLEQNKIWIVDPLDGTSDFVNKTGEFTIMIALVQDHKPILGVIFHPPSDTLYVAQKNQGAFKFQNKIWTGLEVSKISELEKCRAVGSRFHLTPKEQQILEKLKIQKFITRGSSLKVTDICSGNAELYLTTTNKMKQWDTCASHCLIQEAGGKMTDLFGKELLYNLDSLNHENGLLVTNGKIHNQVSEILNSHV